MWNNINEVKPADFQDVLIKLDNGLVTLAKYDYGVFEPVGWNLRWDNNDDNYIILFSEVVEWREINVD